MGSSVRLEDLAIPADRSDTDFQRRAVADLLGRNNLNFPGAQPVSFARHHLRELQQVDYFMCEKTDGIRCLLYLTQHVVSGGGLEEAQYLVDRKNDYYYVHKDTLHVPQSVEHVEAFHTGTLLDGELVRQRNKTPPYDERIMYLIFDCLATDGENIMNRDFSRRLARIDNLIIRPLKAFTKKYPEALGAQPFRIQMKKMEFPYGVEMMFKDILPSLPHGNDGLIFTCKDTYYVSGTDEHVLKWKPPEENTVDFRLILGDFPKAIDEDGEEYEDFDRIPDFQLWVNKGTSTYDRWATLHVTETEWEAMKGMNQPLDGRIIEAYREGTMSEEQGKEIWRPKIEADGTPRFRDDKKDANHISVVDSVLESIRDAVSEQDLMQAAYKIRKAFKERAAERERREAEERKAAEHERRRREAEMRRREEIQKREAERAEKEKQADEAKDGGNGPPGSDSPTNAPNEDDAPTYHESDGE